MRKFILRQLEIVRRGIQEYRIRGVERLQEALAEVIGGVYLNSNLLEKNKEKAEVKTFKKMVSGFASTVITATKLTPYIGPAKSVIGYLLSADPVIPPVDLDR